MEAGVNIQSKDYDKRGQKFTACKQVRYVLTNVALRLHMFMQILSENGEFIPGKTLIKNLQV